MPLQQGNTCHSISLQIGHAGEGGLYAELIQDRSFDALAAASGFATAAGDQYRLDLDLATLPKYGHLASDPILHPKLNDAVDPHQRASSHPPSNDIIIAWQPFQGSQLALNKEIPLKPGNPVAMEVTVGPGQQGGIVNLGYWGIAIKTQEAYALSLYIRNPSSKSIGVHVALVASDLLTLHANLTLEASPSNTTWLRYTGELRSAATDTDARLVVSFPGPATLLFDSVSLFPKENVEAAREKGMANPWPFRPDLLQALKDLKPG